MVSSSFVPPPLAADACGFLLRAPGGLPTSLHFFLLSIDLSFFPFALSANAGVMSSPPVIPSSSTVVAAKKIISLKTLRAWSCSPKQIATWLRQVSSLQNLYIDYCPQLRCFGAGPGDDDTINGGDLDLERALLDLAPSLRFLDINHCENLSSLPSKLRSLNRLETLRIWYCLKIQCLPSAGMPESLKKLVIDGCPELEPRCREEGCPDWPLLSHIPDVVIGD